MSNSSLVKFKQISPNRNSPRTHKIDTITIHCVAGQCTAEGLGSHFSNPNVQASSNYGIDRNGRVGLYVEEKDRSWCSSNQVNDDRAITIECASDAFEPYAINSKVYDSLIKLCVDICKRNGIKKLVWSTNKHFRMAHLNGCNMTVHRDYANKSCPGNYIYNRLGKIADAVNKQLSKHDFKETKTTTETTKKEIYRVRKSWDDSKSQKGAFEKLLYAKKCCNELKDKSYKVYDSKGKVVYPKSDKERIESLAKRVIKGDFGNGEERKRKLGSLYNAVQKRVNEILGG